MKKFLLILPILMTACNPFTSVERDLIGTDPGAGKMRLWTVGNPQDSMLLRRTAILLARGEMNSNYFDVLIARMLATVQDPTNPGVGIAAPQVGVSKQLVCVQRFDKENEPFEFYINPRIESYSEETAIGSEGCLSVPGKRGGVKRSTRIVVTHTDRETFSERSDTVEGFTAVIFQHEIDHLAGRLYTDLADVVEDDAD
ncbi:MAG: peptide deformylase [Rikenellaceae bacterium]|nr:peptide deformylase [Rikenellaceae bacterium]